LHLQARQQEARSYLEDVCDIETVPKFAQQDPANGLEGMLAAFQFMGMGQQNPRELVTLMMGAGGDQDDAADLLDK
jgi:hypothetical protein